MLLFSLINCADDTEKARFAAATARHSSEWLHAMPITTCGLALSNDELRISVCLRLGLQLFRSYQCMNGEIVDELGQHCFICKRNSGKQARHHAINQLIHRELTRCQVPSQLEPSGLFSGSQLSPDEIKVCPWTQGRQLIWDFTCTHTLSMSNLRPTKGETARLRNWPRLRGSVNTAKHRLIYFSCRLPWRRSAHMVHRLLVSSKSWESGRLSNLMTIPPAASSVSASPLSCSAVMRNV